MTQAPIGISPIKSRRSITVTVRKKYDSHVISSRGDATSVSCCGCCAAKLYHTVTLRTKVHSKQACSVQHGIDSRSSVLTIEGM